MRPAEFGAAEARAYFEADELLRRPEQELREACDRLLFLLESGQARAASRDRDGAWGAEAWVKRGILLSFKLSKLAEYDSWPGGAVDKDAYPPRLLGLGEGVRIVPGGSSVRRGASVRSGVVIMPPAFVNVGAYVGEGTMVDSHALVGSCAQIGRGVHLSAGAQIGGVLEPAGARPVVVEDGCFVGALAGAFEGVVLREGCVLAPGCILTASTTVYDAVKGRELRGEIPQGAVVVPGSRPIAAPNDAGAGRAWAAARGLSLYAPVIVKYRDSGTDAALALEEALR